MALFLKVIHIWQKLKSILNWIKANFSAKTYWTFQKIIRKNSWNERSITQRFPGIFKTKSKKLTEKRNKEVNWHVSFNPKIMAEKFDLEFCRFALIIEISARMIIIANQRDYFYTDNNLWKFKSNQSLVTAH